MRKIIVGAVMAVTALGMSASAAAPGPNGRNDYGLCKAYFSGSENGRANKRKAPPFQALEAAAGVDEDDTPEEIEQKVTDYCSTKTPGGKGNQPGAASSSKSAKAKR